MNERQMQFRVGVVMLATMMIGAILATLNGPIPRDLLPWGLESYRIAIELPQAPGVGLNTPVRKNGLLIGRVTEIDDLDDAVVVKADIDGDRRLLTSHVPHVRTSVLGDATIDFVSEPTAAPPQQLTDGATIPGIVDPNPFDSISKLGDLQDDIQVTMQAMARAGNQVADVAERVNEAFGAETEEGRIKRLLDTTELAMTQFAQTMGALNEIFGDDVIADLPAAGRVSPQGQPLPNRQQLRYQPSGPGRQQPATSQPAPGGETRPADQQPPTSGPARQGVTGQPVVFRQPIPAGQLPTSQVPMQPPPVVDPLAPADQPIDGRELRMRLRQGLYELPEAVREARTAMQEFRVVLESANRNFTNLEGFTEPLGERGEQIANSMVDTVEGLDRLVEEFSLLSRALSNREGTIGRLIYDPQAYENLNRLIHNANQVVLQVNDLTLRLRPVLNDARIFMDKVAREPGRVVTGGLNPSSIK